jgi:hypothetical protein
LFVLRAKPVVSVGKSISVIGAVACCSTQLAPLLVVLWMPVTVATQPVVPLPTGGKEIALIFDAEGLVCVVQVWPLLVDLKNVPEKPAA